MNISRLSQRERDLVACIELQAALSIAEIAKRIGQRPHTVQYLFNKLDEAGVIKKSAFIDIHRLGYRYCGIFFSIEGTFQQKRALTTYLLERDQVGWFAELGGPYQFGIAIAVSNPKEADQLLHEMSAASGCHIYKKAVAFRLELVDCPRQYLSSRRLQRPHLAMSDGAETVQIDSVDRRVLSALSSFTDMSHRKMALKAKMPHTSFDLRLRKLQELKVFLGTTIRFDPSSVGRQQHKILLFGRGKNPTLGNTLRAFALNHELVMHYVECFGEWDFELNIEAENSADVTNFIDVVHSQFGQDLRDIVPMNVATVRRVDRYPFKI